MILLTVSNITLFTYIAQMPMHNFLGSITKKIEMHFPLVFRSIIDVKN